MLSDELSDEEISAGQAIEILSVIIGKLPEETKVSAIIHRLDQCSWPTDDKILPPMLQAVVQALLELVKEASCHVKVQLVVEAASARQVKDSDSDLVKQRDQTYLHEPYWVEETEEEWTAKHGPGLIRAYSSPV